MKIPLLGKLFNRTKKDQPERQENLQPDSEKVVRVSDEFEIRVKGMPENLSNTEQKQIITSLLKNGLNLSRDKLYKKGESVFHGKALINMKDKAYQIEYSITAMKVLQALVVYKEAFDYVNEGAESGKFDPSLAEMAADFLKESAWQEIQHFNRSKTKTITEIRPVTSTEKQLSTDTNKEQEQKKHVNK